MTRFFFHVRNGKDDISLDTEGQELPSLDAARREALNASREMLSERLLHGGALGRRQIEIADDKGKVLAVVKARDTLLKENHLRSFDDDVTKSAPSARMREMPAKPGTR